MSRPGSASYERASGADPVVAPPPGPDAGEGGEPQWGEGVHSARSLTPFERHAPGCTDRSKLRLAGLDIAGGGEQMNAPYQDEEGLWLKPRKDQPHTTSRYLGR
jgi:hypothetical protein